MDENSKFRLKLRKRILTLRKHGIKKVHVAFSGNGDEGQINGVVFEPELNQSARFNLNSFEEILYDYLDPARVGDWINNDGGFGEIDIDTETLRIEGEINFNITSVETEELSFKI